MFRLTAPERADRAAGFTLIEVLVALSVVAVTLTAIGSLVATAIRGTRALDAHLTLVETIRTIVTGLPERERLQVGDLTGEADGMRWRVDVTPFPAPVPRSDRGLPPWLPETVTVRVQAPQGKILRLDTVRLRRRPQS